MAKEQLKINIELRDIGLVKNLVELLELHFDNLPIELQNQLKEIEETGINDFTADDLHSMFPDFDGKKFECSHTFVTRINKILKRVNVYQDGEIKLYPEHFYLRYDNKSIIEW